jgi:hypothetical protein
MSRTQAAFVDLPDRVIRTLPFSVARAITAQARQVFRPLAEAATACADDKVAAEIVRSSVIPAMTTGTAPKGTEILQTLAVLTGPTSAFSKIAQAALGLSLDGNG